MVRVTPNRSTVGSLIGLLAAAVLIAGCGSSSSSSSTASAPSSSSAAPAASTGGAVAISTTKGAVGTYLTGASGRALYMWGADTSQKSNCSGQCAKFWPPLIATTAPKLSGGASATDVATITRADGTKQVTYKGHPLYYFLEDAKAGTLHGQGNNGFGAKWWLVAPTGAVITRSANSAPASAGSSSSAGHSAY